MGVHKIIIRAITGGDRRRTPLQIAAELQLLERKRTFSSETEKNPLEDWQLKTSKLWISSFEGILLPWRKIKRVRVVIITSVLMSL